MKIENKPLNALIIGLCFVVSIAVISSPQVQLTLAKWLDRDTFVVNTPSPSVAGIDSELEFARVSRVLDGDTVVLDDGRVIRYLNIDAPETAKPDKAEDCFATASRELNARLVDTLEVVLRSDKEDRDQYGRYLRFVFVRGVDYNKIENSVNARLVQRGYAQARIIEPNDTYEAEFLSYEKQAQDDIQGIWFGCPEFRDEALNQ